MADYLYLENGIVIDEDGEIVDAAGHDDPLAYIATRRADAKIQLKEWESYIEGLDRVLLRKQMERRMSYGDVVIRIGGGRYYQTNAKALAEMLSDAEARREDLVGLLAAAKGFRKDEVPEPVRFMYEDVTAAIEKKPWIESAVARKSPPVVRREPVEASDD